MRIITVFVSLLCLNLASYADNTSDQLAIGYHYVTVNVSNHRSQPVQAAFAMETTKFIGPFWPFLGLRFDANQNKAIRADNPNGRLEYLLGNDENFASISFTSGNDSCTVYLKGCAQYMKFWCGGFFTASSDESRCSIRPTALNVFAVDIV